MVLKRGRKKKEKKKDVWQVDGHAPARSGLLMIVTN